MGNDFLYVLFFAKCERMRSCDNVDVFKEEEGFSFKFNINNYKISFKNKKI
jgi:hypothetical protein